MSHFRAVHAINRAALVKTTASIAELDQIIDGYKEEDHSLEKAHKKLLRQQKELESKRILVDRALKNAQTSKQALESSAERLRCLSPPICQIPDEVLRHILRLVVHQRLQSHRMYPDTAYQAPRVTPAPPIILGQVCSLWRSIVRQDPKIWDHVLIGITSTPLIREVSNSASLFLWNTCGMRQTQSVFIEHWMKRLPFHLITSNLGSSLTPFKSINIGVRDCNNSGEWDSQAIRAEDVSIVQSQSVTSLQYYMPLMRGATVLSISGTPPKWNTGQWTSLRSLTLRPFPKTPRSSPEPLQFTSSDFQDLLQAAPNLKHFEMDSIIERGRISGGVNKTTKHLSLSSISLYLSHFGPSSGPFGVHLDAPSLTHLKILCFDRHTSTSPDLPMASWDQPTILTLYNLSERDVSPSLVLFRTLPNLYTLNLEGRNIEAALDLINALYNISQPEYSLPLLRLGQITLKNTDVRGKTLIKFIEARLLRIEQGQKEINAITDVNLYDNSGIKPGDWKRVNGLLERGQQVMNGGAEK